MPERPTNLRVNVVDLNKLSVEFHSPPQRGGPPVSSYRVQYDRRASFDSGTKGTPLGEMDVLGNAITLRSEVQAFSVVSEAAYTVGGTFSLSFLGHATKQLDANITSEVLKSSLEALPSVRGVEVDRVLWCSQEKGLNNCGDLRGYTWMVTFTDPIDAGEQFESSGSLFETLLNSRLQIDGSYLKSCPSSDPLNCNVGTPAQAFIHAYQEVQEACICDAGATVLTLLGQTASIAGPATSTKVRAALASITGVGAVTVVLTSNSANCACSIGLGKKFDVTFDALSGDVPLIVLSNGLCTEKTKGSPQLVKGVEEHSALLDAPLFSTLVPIYIRVAAVNAVGTSPFSVHPTAVVPYIAAPLSIQTASASVVSSSEVRVVWSDVIRAGTSGAYTVQWDTNRAFASSCGAATCSAQTTQPLHSISVPFSSVAPVSSVLATDLTPGVPYFFRIRKCLLVAPDSICSVFTYIGSPVVAQDVASYVLGGTVTLVEGAAAAVDFVPSISLAEGSNGAAISSYLATLSLAASEVQEVTVSNIVDPTQLFSLAMGGQSTRCMTYLAQEEEIKIKLEELATADTVTVVRETPSNSSVRLVLTFSGSVKSRGVVYKVALGSTVGCAVANATLSSTVITKAQKAYAPATMAVSTSATGTVSGLFELRYGFKGDMVKLLSTPSGGVAVSCSIVGGQSTLVASSDVTHYLAPGVVIRVGDQEHTIVSVATNTAVFSPYRLRSATNSLIYVPDTLLGVGHVTNGSSLVANIFSPFSDDVFIGDEVLITQVNSATMVTETQVTHTVSAKPANGVSTSQPIAVFGVGAVALYRQQNKLLPSDASVAEMRSAVESFSLVRSASVGRQGPTSIDTFTWTVALTSVVSPSTTSVSTKASSALLVQSCSNAFLNGQYVSDSFIAGRRRYSLLNGPFRLAFAAPTSRWTFYALNQTSIAIAAETSTTNSVLPSLATFSLGCAVSAVAAPVSLLSGTGAAVSVTTLSSSIYPDLEVVAASAALGNRTSEIQSVEVSAVDGLIFGGFEVDFNNSGIRIAIRADETAADFSTKLESIPTVGRVQVQRMVLENALGQFVGYRWLVTFLTVEGDLPLLAVNASPLVGAPLSGNGVRLLVEEEVKGIAAPTSVVFSDLAIGGEYTTQVYPVSGAGIGLSSILGQDSGMGIAPLSFQVLDSPDAPVIRSLVPRSASQLELVFAPQNNGGADVHKYLVEYSTDSNFGYVSNLTFTITNAAGNDSNGFWRMSFDSVDTYYLPWAASADEVKAAVENIGSVYSVSVTRTRLFVGVGSGYQYDIAMMNEVDILSLATFAVDVSQLGSEGSSNAFVATVLRQNEAFTPANYRSQWIYATCNQARINITSDHQVITVSTALPDVYGTGSYRLSFGSETTRCIDYSASLDDIHDALVALDSVNYVFLEEFKRVDAAGAVRDVHVFLEGGVADDWPQLRLVPFDNGVAWGAAYSANCAVKSLATTSVRVASLEDRTACSGGSAEIQAIVAEAEYSLDGYFYVYFGGSRSTPLSVAASAEQVASAISALLPSGSVSVARFHHVDAPRLGLAWTVTFPTEMGNVNTLVIDDQHVTGVHAGVGAYPLLNITTTADAADITGHFIIALDEESTIPLAWDATDGAVLNAMTNLTQVGRAAMVGLRDQESAFRPTFTAAVTIGAQTSFTINADLSASVAVGDAVLFSGYADTAVGRYVTGILVSSGVTYFNMSETAVFSAATVTVSIGVVKRAKLQLPGKVSLTGVTGNTTSALVLYTTAPWNGLVVANDLIWVGDYELTITATPLAGANTIACSGIVPYAFQGAVAYYWGKGFERSIIVKAATTSIRNARTLLMSDMRATNLIVTTDHSDGVAPNSLLLGSIFAVQTVSFRPDSLAASLLAQSLASSLSLTLELGSEFTTAVNLTYGASAQEWKRAIESMINVDRVTVTRLGDGRSPLYAFGYTYTVKYWGKYGIRPIPQLSVNGSVIAAYANLAGVSVYEDVVQHGEVISHFSSRYVALNENQKYFARVTAFNRRGVSPPSTVVSASTELYGGLPLEPQSVVLGQYKTATSLSLSFKEPIHDGGLPVSAFLVEVDSSLEFDSSSSAYQSLLLENVPEVQRIVTSFRAGDNVKTRGGTFIVGFGGQLTAPLAFDISAYDLQVALNFAFGFRSIAEDPVTVTRTPFNRGFRWTVTFVGLRGNVGLLSVDGSMLTGDDPRVSVAEVTRGSADIVPGAYTYEVQTVSTTALSTISGQFSLVMEGYTTPLISHDETAVSFRQKLEALPTIYAVKVRRIPLSAQKELFSWVITFAHMRREVVQGAGRLPPLTVGAAYLEPAASASVQVFEAVKGTDPLHITLSGLEPGVVYNARVVAYNDRGYSQNSHVSAAMPLGQPVPPSVVSIGVASPTSLNVSWIMAPGFDYFQDSFFIESYSSTPVHEVQVITTSSTASLIEIQRITLDADANNIGGFFRLGLGGLQTRNIRWNANAGGDGSLAMELTRLSTVGPVSVTRALSRRPVHGLRVDIANGASSAIVVAGSTTTLGAGDIVWISGEQFTVVAVTAGSITLSAPLASPSLSSVNVFKWSFGFTWDVSFLSKIGDVALLSVQTSDNWAGTNPVLKVVALRNGVEPLAGTFRVGYRGSMTPPLVSDISETDMKLALEALDTIAEVDVTRFANGYGHDWRVTFKSELGNVESMAVNDASLSGPFAAAAVSTAIEGALPLRYSTLSVQGGYARSAVISGLEQGVGYQVRIRSHNSLGYSYATASTPAYLSPKAPPTVPYNISIFALSRTRLRVNWFRPVNTGGADITQYTVQWDIVSSFNNAVASGNTRTIEVTNRDGPVFCITIDIAASSNTVPRFARVSAFNGYASSPFGYPTPISATGQVHTPGAPSSVQAVATDSVGILVSWDVPDAATCFFGGDGGSVVTLYVVEWDVREDFSSPASQAFVYDLLELSYLIGGRNLLTGKMQTELTPGGEYFVRVTAFNSVGAGTAGYAMGPIVLRDQPPLEPRNVRLSPVSATRLYASWDAPLRDGGATLEKYRLEYSSNTSFADYVTVDLPLMSEVQAVAIDSPVTIETQAVTLLARVTNERQVIRSTLGPSVDEVQSVTLFCDDVTNEVQRVETTASDFDEKQTVELTGTEVHEVQLLQSYVRGVPEIQTVEVSSPRVNEVQVFGVIVQGVDTSSCSAGAACAAVEAGLSGFYRLQFDPNQCGTFSDKIESNWCAIALNDDGVTGYDCSATSCLTTFIDITSSASVVQAALCAIKGSGAVSFMLSPDGLCVAVTRTAYAMNVNATAGVYAVSYSVEFTGQYVRGSVPALAVSYSNVSHSATSVFLNTFTNSSGSTVALGSVQRPGNVALTLVEGNQPDGLFTLTYACEARTVKTVVNVTDVPNSDTSIISVSAAILVQFQYILILDKYHQIISVDSTAARGVVSPAFDLSPYQGISTFANAEVGAFYSDPSDFYGVSAACYTPNIHITLDMNQSVTEYDLNTKLRALSPVVVDSDDSLTITRSYYPSTASRIGYIWTIVFNRQNGDLIPMACNDAFMFGTNSIGGAACLVNTVQNGSLVDGDFSISVMSPNSYIATPLNYSSLSLPWNIDPASLASILSATTGFGVVDVSREAYSAGQSRWSGGYIWTISFTGALMLMLYCDRVANCVCVCM